MIPIISIGPLSIPAATLILLLGIWLGSLLMSKQAKSHGRSEEILDQIVWTALAVGVVGARLSYIARNPWAFQGQVLSIFSLNPALLDGGGGILIALAAGYYLISKNKLDILQFLDDLVPFLAAGTLAIYLANFAAGAGFGTNTNLPWGIELWGATRHPVQLYFSLAGLTVLVLVLTDFLKYRQAPGQYFTTFTILTSGYLTFLTSFQDPIGNLFYGFRPFQISCLIVYCLSVTFYPLFKYGKQP